MTLRRWRPHHLWFLLSGSFLVLGLAGAAIDTGNRPPTPQEVVATLPPISLGATPPSTGLKVVRAPLQRGERLNELLERLGADDPLLIDYTLSSPEGQALQRRLLAGGDVTVRYDEAGRVALVHLPLTRGERVLIERQEDDRFRITPTSADNELARFVEVREGAITASLFATADAIGLPAEIASRLAEVFGTEIDFSRDLRVGDSFVVLYETRLDPLGEVEVGDILAAQFINNGKRYEVIRHTDAHGESAFYTPDGRVLGTGFLRYPLKFSRVSSTFGLREHPVTGQVKNHFGVDLAAPNGTPVLAASDGVVAFKGWQGGYGNLTILSHRNGYETRYGHLAGFAPHLKVGQRVKQGDIIAFSGATGLVTGPHLHYEVRIQGKPYNPQTVKLPAPEPLTGKALAEFRAATASTRTLLAVATRQTAVEVADEGARRARNGKGATQDRNS